MGRYFDGSGDNIIVARSSSIEPARFTLSAWAFLGPTPPSGWNPIFHKDYTSHEDPFYTYALDYYYTDDDTISLYGTAVVGNWTATDQVEAAGIASEVLNKWAHAAFTFDESNLRLYLNGTLRDTQANAGSLTYHATDLYIGQFRNVASSVFKGKLASLAIWGGSDNTGVLSLTEIAALANGEDPARMRPANLRLYMPLWGIG